MCTTCGCAAGNLKIEGDDHHHHDHDHDHGHSHDHHHHDHSHAHGHSQPQTVIHHHYHGTTHVHYHISGGGQLEHTHGHDHDHHHHHEHSDNREAENFKPELDGEDLHYGKGAAHTHAPGMSQSRMVQIEMDILGKNNELAEKNRTFFNAQNAKVLNLVSSPGSGKTTLLTETLTKLSQTSDRQLAVIEGDQQTANDADRIRATGVKAIQINTGKGCHLDAAMVGEAAARLGVEKDALLFIENVGNLVCPAGFDLGEKAKVAILSVTEGEDKPLKYPDMFSAADLMILNKTDLLPYLDFDVQACIDNARRVNPTIKVIQLSAKSGEGMDEWFNYLNK